MNPRMLDKASYGMLAAGMVMLSLDELHPSGFARFVFSLGAVGGLAAMAGFQWFGWNGLQLWDLSALYGASPPAGAELLHGALMSAMMSLAAVILNCTALLAASAVRAATPTAR